MKTSSLTVEEMDEKLFAFATRMKVQAQRIVSLADAGLAGKELNPSGVMGLAALGANETAQAVLASASVQLEMLGRIASSQADIAAALAANTAELRSIRSILELQQ